MYLIPALTRVKEAAFFSRDLLIPFVLQENIINSHNESFRESGDHGHVS